MTAHEIAHLDPDWDHVPTELLALYGQPVAVADDDGPPAVLVIAPGLFGHSARLRNGFYEGNTDAA